MHVIGRLRRSVYGLAIVQTNPKADYSFIRVTADWMMIHREPLSGKVAALIDPAHEKKSRESYATREAEPNNGDVDGT